MISRWLFIGLVAGFFLIAFVVTWISLTGASLSPAKQVLETCTPIHNAGPGKPSFVFFAPEKEAQQYANYLLSLSPFKEHESDFNLYAIENYNPPCELYENIALYCYSKEVIEKAASCPNVNYIAVFEDRPAKIRSSAFMQVASINTALPKSVLVHELGHVIAHLSEEYNSGVTPSAIAGNCQKSCTDFPSKVDGCFEECSKGGYMRSIDSGIMRSLSAARLGTFDEKVISDKLTKTSLTGPTGNAILFEDSCENQAYWLMEASLENGKFKLISQELKSGCAPRVTAGEATYYLSKQGAIIEGGSFNPNTLFTDGPGPLTIEGITASLSSSTVYLASPTAYSADKLSLTNKDFSSEQFYLGREGGVACKTS